MKAETMAKKTNDLVTNPKAPPRWAVFYDYRTQPNGKPIFVGYGSNRTDIDKIANTYIDIYDVFIYQLSEQCVVEPTPVKTTKVEFSD